MTDPSLIQHAAPHAKHIAHATVQAAPVIKQGFSMLTIFISNLLTAAIFGGGAWYVRGRGVQGVKVDLANAQAELSKVKGQATAAVNAAQAVA